MKTLHKLNAKSIKKALLSYDIKALRCKQGSGSTKNAVNIVVKYADADKALNFIKEFGIVNVLGNTPEIGFSKSVRTYVDFGNLYMSAKMFNELNK